MVDFTASYTGRDVDIYIMDLPEPGFEGEAKLTFQGKTGGTVCSGIQKLAQIYLLTLLTGIQSKLLLPAEGTALGSLQIGVSNVVQQDLQHLVNIGHVEAVEQILTEQGDVVDSGLEEIPDDETLAEATVLNLSISNCTSLSFTVLLVAVSGASTTFVVPLSLVP